jgi:aspartate carbamoyltransferase catalytic subunit
MIEAFFAQDILSIKDCSRTDLEGLFTLAVSMEDISRGRRCQLISDKVIASLFFQPSTRTQLSFSSAIQRLGGGVIGFSDPKMTRSGDFYQEDLADTIQMVRSYSDAIIMRHFITGAPTEAAKYSDVPIINGGDGYGEHPTQAMIDLYTIWKTKKKLDGLRIGILGDLNQRSIRSFALGIAKWEVEFICVAPNTMRFTDDFLGTIKSMGRTVEYSSDIREVISQMEVLYVMSVIQPSYSEAHVEAQKEKEKSKIPLEYLVNRRLLNRANTELMVLHPLPRKTELSRDVDDLPQAHYIQQATNGVPLRMALLSAIFGRMP